MAETGFTPIPVQLLLYRTTVSNWHGIRALIGNVHANGILLMFFIYALLSLQRMAFKELTLSAL